ncbi:PP2C family protein-serine/threonine phosphatase, partial [Streptomyces bobili]
DWFDVIALPEGRTGLVIGDVMGHGIHAAAVMGQLRTAVRTLARHDMHPARLLRSLDAVVADMGED